MATKSVAPSAARSQPTRSARHIPTALNGDDSYLVFSIVHDVATTGAFDEAVKGADGVIHTAFLFVTQVDNNERDLLDPAIKSTTSILQVV